MKIHFIFSHQYENVLSRGRSAVSTRTIFSKKKSLDFFWKSNKANIVNCLKKITGLSFTQKEISCYLNSIISLSDPLTLKIEHLSDMKDNLVHELIHVLFTQNYYNNMLFRKKWDQYMKIYSSESRLTQSHVAVHATHLLITKTLFPRRLRFIQKYSHQIDYLKSWSIVKEEGSENIVKLISIV